MSNYFICVGGTGSRIGEAFVYLSATGYLGSGKTQIWIVDKDTKCANGSILHAAVNEYAAVRSNCLWQEAPCFTQELSLNEWNFDDALKQLDPNATGESAFKALGGGSKEVGCVMKFLHDAESLDNSMSRGFYGRAQTGTALYKAIEQIPNLFDKDALFSAIRDDINKGETPSVYLAGSSFGATGASLLPNMAKTLRNQFSNRVAIGAVLMLPYFSYETMTSDGSKALVSPETHWEKAREALRYYGDERRMSIRRVGDPLRDPGATLDAFYVVGCTPLAAINSNYADGGEGQDNKSHIAELYAAMGARHFFELAQNGKEDENNFGIPASYAYCLGDGADFNWNRIDPALKVPMLSLTRFSLAVLTFLHPLTHQKEPLKKNDTLQKCFGKTRFMGGDARIDDAVMQDSVKNIADFSRRFLDYVQYLNYIGPDVALFDSSFLGDLFTVLDGFSPLRGSASRLRDLTLSEAYSEEERKKVYSLCQMLWISANPNAPIDPRAKETNIGQLQDYIIQQMGPFKSAGIGAGDFGDHTRNGMRKMYQCVYDMGRSFKFG